MGKDHFFAVANTKESRKDEKYRCFLKNRDDDYYLGKLIKSRILNFKEMHGGLKLIDTYSLFRVPLFNNTLKLRCPIL